MRLVWTEPVRLDLREIFTYIAQENPNAAKRLLAEIKEKVILLQDNPMLGRSGRVDGTRELVITGTQYILPYRINNGQIQILAAFHCARQWPDKFNDLKNPE